jgi:hypothetical protein
MANDFSMDTNCKALWRFENGALTVDSKGSNTLSVTGSPTANLVDFKEGGASADFELGSPDYYTVADASLDAGFPLKNGDTNKKISVCAWLRMESIPTFGINFFGKWGTGTRSLLCQITGTSGGLDFRILLGHNGGLSSETIIETSIAALTGRWYHFGFTYQDSDKSWKLRIWDDTAGAIYYSNTGHTTNNINIENATLYVGGYLSNSHDGEMDEVVVFDDILTNDEIDAIRAGTYSGLQWAKILTANPVNIADNEYCKLATNDVIGRNYAEVKTDLGLSTGDSPEFTGLTLSGLTANSLIYPDGNKLLTSLGVAANGKIPIGSAGTTPVLAEITGTANQVISTAGAGSITLSTPQDIHTGATDFEVAGLKVINKITEFSTDGTMGGDSDSAVPTEKATKLYTDTLRSDLASVANAKGASLVGVEDAMSLYTATDVEAALEEVMDKVTPVTYSANAISTVGGTPSGSVSDIQTIDDGNEYIVTETTGAPNPNFTTTVTFTGITTGHEANKIQAHYSYDGNHTINLDIEKAPFDGSAWDNVTSITNTGGVLAWLSIDIPGSITDYNNSGTTKIRWLHDAVGNVNHDFVVDYNIIKDDSSGGGGVTEHGALTGLGDDDHAQYLLADGTRALAGAWDMGSQALTNVNIDSGAITGITDLAIADGGTGQSTAQLAINALSAVAGATNEHVLTKDTGTGNAIWKAAAGGGGGTWIDLTDTDPANFTGSAGKIVRVNSTPDALEFFTVNDLVTDVAPQAAADYVMIYDTTASAHKKVLLSNLPVGGGIGYTGYVKLSDTKAQNTSGGTATSGAWRTRVLNTEDIDTDNDCSLVGNQITLAAGTYDCLISAPAWYAGRHQARLYNTTGAAVVLIGTSEFAQSGIGDNKDQTRSIIRGRFTIAASQVLEVQHQVTITRATHGFGVECNFTSEIYTIAEFWKAATTSDELIKIDAAATAGYLGAASNDGVLRTGVGLTYTDGGNFVTLAVDGFSAYTSEDSDTVDMLVAHAYLAQTDGFVSANIIADNDEVLRAHVGDTNDPEGAGDIICLTKSASVGGRINCSFMVPSGKYFELTTTSAEVANIFWMSMGALQKPVDQD